MSTKPAEDSINVVQTRQEEISAKLGIRGSLFCQAPSHYYSLELEQRRRIVGAASIDHLWKSVIMHNSKCDHTGFSDSLDSKYYLVIVQYSTAINNEMIIKAIRALQIEKIGKAMPKKKLNFRLVPEAVSAALTGFGHNAVSPLGMREKLPIILSHRALKLLEQPGADYMWLGGGHVDLKWKCPIAEFLRVFQPLIVNFTDKDGCALE